MFVSNGDKPWGKHIQKDELTIQDCTTIKTIISIGVYNIKIHVI